MKLEAEIRLDPADGKLVCKTPGPAHRRELVRVLRTVAPNGRWAHDAGSISLDVKSALGLRSTKVGLSLTWTEEASAFVNNFAAAYATRNEGRRQLLKLQGEGVANEILRDYELTHNLDRHQRVAVAAMTDPVINGLCLF